MKIPVVGRGTKGVSTKILEQLAQWLTVVDLRNGKVPSRYGSRISIEALEPVSHGGLGVTVVPNDVDEG